MEIDRKMARCLLEIKRSLPHAKQSEFNLSSPNIKKIVFNVHRTTTDNRIKAFAAAFLGLSAASREGNSQRRILNTSAQENKPEKVIKPQRQRINTEAAKLSDRKSYANITSPKLVIIGDSKKKPKQNELLNSGILPEFLEHIDVSELPPLAGSSSSIQGRFVETNRSLKTKKPQLKSARRGTTLLDKVATFLTTPIELSMPIKFAKKHPDASN